MNLRSGIASIGVLLGIGAITGLFFGLGVGWIGLGVVVGLSIVSYLVAAIGQSSRTSISGFGEFMRGWLIGNNTALNGFLAFAIMNAIVGMEVGVIVGASLALLNLLTVFRPISQSEVFQFFVGWFNWVLPMSWLVLGLGLVFLLLSLLLWAVTGGRVEYLRLMDSRADWKTGTFFVKGGLFANLNYRNTAFNMGSFAFVDKDSRGGWHKRHEAGHTLNLAAFGSLFHLLGALDENVVPARGELAYAERLAESNDSGIKRPNIPMWA